MVPFQADTLDKCLGEGDQDKATEGPQPGALGQFSPTCSDEYGPYLSQAPLPAGKHCFTESIHPGRAQGIKKILPFDRWKNRGRGKRGDAVAFPQVGSGQVAKPLPHLPPAPLDPLPASPAIAVDLRPGSGGVLSALVGAGAPFQGHTPVLMPDLRGSEREVSGLQWANSLSQRQAGEPRPRLGLETQLSSTLVLLAQLETPRPPLPSHTAAGRSPGTQWRPQ